MNIYRIAQRNTLFEFTVYVFYTNKDEAETSIE